MDAWDDLDLDGLRDGLRACGRFQLQEPSAAADRRVRSLARARLEAIRIESRRARAARAVLGAALAFGAAVLVTAGVRPWGIEEAAAPGAGGSCAIHGAPGPEPEVLRSTVVELRREIEEIDEMAELIPEERAAQRDEIAERVRACLGSLERLEEELTLIQSGSLGPGGHLSRKELRA